MEHGLQPLKRFGLVSLATIAILAIVLSSWSCSRGSYSGPLESITLGAPLLEGALPLFIAQDLGFFTQNGLNVTIKSYDTGVKALNDLFKGQVDIAPAVSEYTAVGQVFNHQPVKILGCISKIDNISIIGRKDRGIETASDLKGKKMGILPGTIIEFYLGRFLELHAISVNYVTSVDIGTLQQSVDSLVSGKVDAALLLPPYDKMALDQLGNNAVVFPAQSGQYSYTLVVSDSEWLSGHSNLVERFLKALDQSEEFIVINPQEAKAIVKKKLNLTDEYISRTWSQNQFSLSLDESLISAMEDEARWMISNNLTTEKQVPNFNDYISEDGLKAIKPEAVNIIR